MNQSQRALYRIAFLRGAVASRLSAMALTMAEPTTIPSAALASIPHLLAGFDTKSHRNRQIGALLDAGHLLVHLCRIGRRCSRDTAIDT